MALYFKEKHKARVGLQKFLELISAKERSHLIAGLGQKKMP